MTTKKMMLVSILATSCLSILAIVALVGINLLEGDTMTFSKQLAPVHQAKPQQQKEPTLEEVEPIDTDGLQQVTDDTGLHDIFYDEKNVQLKSTTAPIIIHVKNVYLEQFYPSNTNGRRIANGYDEVAVVRLDVQFINTSDKQIYYAVNKIRMETDSGVSTMIDGVLSDPFSNTFQPNETQQGTLTAIFTDDAKKMAYVNVLGSKPQQLNTGRIFEGFTLKIPFY